MTNPTPVLSKPVEENMMEEKHKHKFKFGGTTVSALAGSEQRTGFFSYNFYYPQVITKTTLFCECGEIKYNEDRKIIK